MRKLFLTAIAVLVAFIGFMSCTEDFITSNPPASVERIRTDTIERTIILDGDTIYFWDIVFNGVKDVSLAVLKKDCRTNTIDFKSVTSFYETPDTIREFSYTFDFSFEKEDKKEIGVKSLDIESKSADFKSHYSYSRIIDIEPGVKALSTIKHTGVEWKFSEGIVSRVSMNEEIIRLFIDGKLFEESFTIEREILLGSFNISSTPSEETETALIHPMTVSFQIKTIDGDCPEDIVNEIDLYLQKENEIVVSEEKRNRWFKLQPKPNCWYTNFFPSYYDSFYDVWRVYSDGREEFVRRESARGTLKWCLATDGCKNVSYQEFQNLHTEENLIPNGIRLGTNLKEMNSTVIVGSVPEDFLYPVFEWQSLQNSISPWGYTMKINDTKAEASCDEINEKGETSTKKFTHQATYKYYKSCY